MNDMPNDLPTEIVELLLDHHLIKDESSGLVNKVLKEFFWQYATIRWSITDVQSVDPSLTEQQAREVLEWLEETHDANEGINWMTIIHGIESVK